MAELAIEHVPTAPMVATVFEMKLRRLVCSDDDCGLLMLGSTYDLIN